MHPAFSLPQNSASPAELEAEGYTIFYLDYKRIVVLGTRKSDKEERESNSLPSNAL